MDLKMTDTATPATAPDATATIDDRHAHVMNILNADKKLTEEPETVTQSDQPEAEAPEDDQPTAETPEAESEDDTEPDTEETETPETYRVKVDGEEVEVTLDELLKGYSRTEDYKRKTAKVAEERRTVETLRDQELQKIREVSQRYLQDFQSGSQDKAILDEAGRVDWAKLAQENPNQYIAARAKVEAAQARLQAAEQQSDAARQQLRQRENAKIMERLGLDENNAGEVERKVVGYLSDGLGKDGLPTERIANAISSLTAYEFELAWKAMKYDEAEAQKKQSIQKIAEKRVIAKTADPSRKMAANAVTESKKALKARIAKTSDLRERAGLIAQFNNLYPKERA